MYTVLEGWAGGAPIMLQKLGLYSCTIFDLSACAESAKTVRVLKCASMNKSKLLD